MSDEDEQLLRDPSLCCCLIQLVICDAGQAVSLALGVHWVANFGIGQLFLPAVEKFGLSKVYLFFAAICFATVIFTQSTVPETKGKSLEEIEALLA